MLLKVEILLLGLLKNDCKDIIWDRLLLLVLQFFWVRPSLPEFSKILPTEALCHQLLIFNTVFLIIFLELACLGLYYIPAYKKLVLRIRRHSFWLRVWHISFDEFQPHKDRIFIT